jgi:hypothetical protein
MARIIYQEQEHVVPDGEMQGEELLKALRVPSGHNLVVIRQDGNRLVHRHDKVLPVDDDYFLDAPMFEYGAPKV